MDKIKTWSIQDRPREKLIQKGRSILTDAELLALIIGNGYKDRSAVSLARDVLFRSSNNLNLLAKSSLEKLLNCKGIGEAKAVSIIAAFELGRRRMKLDEKKAICIQKSSDAFNFINSRLIDLAHEEMWVIMLNRANKLISAELISKGGIDATCLDSRILFNKALAKLACSFILVHNHPSGNLSPSKSDIQITNKIKKAGEIMDIKLLDHLIVVDNDYFSFSDKGMI